MSFKIFAGCCLVASAALGPAACVGDTATGSGPAVGDLGGACFPNGTCSMGLSCVLTGGTGKCQLAGDGGAQDTSMADQSSGDTGGGDSASNDAADAGPSCPLAQYAAFSCVGQVDCYDNGMAQHMCLPDQNTCLSFTAYQQPDSFACFHELNCGAGDVCCLRAGSLIDTSACPGTIDMPTGTTSACGASLGQIGTCPSMTDNVLCAKDSGCPMGQRCFGVQVTKPPGLPPSTLFGICR